MQHPQGKGCAHVRLEHTHPLNINTSVHQHPEAQAHVPLIPRWQLGLCRVPEQAGPLRPQPTSANPPSRPD